MIEPKEKTILIVDDDDSVRLVFMKMLTGDGFKVLTAPSGNDALGMLKQGAGEKVDLVILDLMMPGRGGYDVIKTLQEPGYQNVPVIVLTARVKNDEVVERYVSQPNVKAFLSKPGDVLMLRSKVHEILGTANPTRP